MHKVILTNSFHNTKCTVLSNEISPYDAWYNDVIRGANLGWDVLPSERKRYLRVWNTLCGIEGCTCGTFRP
jgi:hypothetical protein